MGKFLGQFVFKWKTYPEIKIGNQFSLTIIRGFSIDFGTNTWSQSAQKNLPQFFLEIFYFSIPRPNLSACDQGKLDSQGYDYGFF